MILGFISVACSTREQHYGKATFTLPPGLSRIHSPGIFAAMDRSRLGEVDALLMVQRGTHDLGPEPIPPARWQRTRNTMAADTLSVTQQHSGVINVREVRRTDGRHAGVRTMDYVVSADVIPTGGLSRPMVISSRLFVRDNDFHLFILAEARYKGSNQSPRFDSLMSTVHFP
ncbi:hypothetical protein [Luteolibacter sp. Populi]|uniref:hypothetical protein n=1 Tax=Luteolibacter sp. Populi TaxID=3230487 RepID=UPI003466A95E